MFTVVLCGIESALSSKLDHPFLVILDASPEDPEFLGLAADCLAATSESTDAVIVVFPASRATDRRVQAARNLSDCKKVAALPLDLPDAGVLVLAVLLADLALAGVSAGTTLARLPDVLRATVIAGCTSSVTGLRLPGVRLADHVRSWWPGSSFLVQLTPRTQVTPRPRRPSAHHVPRVISGERRWRVVLSGEPSDGPQLMAVLDGAGADVRVHRTEGADTSRWWGGARRVLELAAIPSDVSELAAELRHSPFPRCRTCQDALSESVCPFCSALEAV